MMNSPLKEDSTNSPNEKIKLDPANELDMHVVSNFKDSQAFSKKREIPDIDQL